MEKYIVRMETEKKELEGKIKKLEMAVVNKSLHLKPYQVDVMNRQLKAMQEYNDILTERIAYEKAKK